MTRFQRALSVTAVVLLGGVVGLFAANAGAPSGLLMGGSGAAAQPDGAAQASAEGDTRVLVASGCERLLKVPEDLADPTPISARFGSIPSLPILGVGNSVAVTSLPSTVPVPRDTKWPIQLVLEKAYDTNEDGAHDETSFEFFIAGERVREGERLEEFIQRGGIYVTVQDDIPFDAATVLDALREQDRDPLPPVVRVADFDAVLIHADPIVDDELRPYHLYWSDGEYSMSIQADADPVDLVNLARRLYCEA